MKKNDEFIQSQNEKMQLAYILPNLFTAASVFLGIISILASANGQFEKAGLYIFLALIFDGLDGRIARLTNTTSKFGAEFDSLADIVSFGVAPSVMFYFAIAQDFGKIGSLIVALYVVFGSIRLARFNITSLDNEPSVFIGLPIPTAAIFLTLWILMWSNYDFVKGHEKILILSQAILALLMVSNIRYPSFKQVDFKRVHVTKILVILSVVFSLIYLRPLETATTIVSFYLLYGIMRACYTVVNIKIKKIKK